MTRPGRLPNATRSNRAVEAAAGDIAVAALVVVVVAGPEPALIGVLLSCVLSLSGVAVHSANRGGAHLGTLRQGEQVVG